MANIVHVDGERYISESLLIESMAKACVAYTTTDDPVVSNDEANQVAAYIDYLRRGGLISTLNKFKETYVTERFIKRTLGTV